MQQTTSTKRTPVVDYDSLPDCAMLRQPQVLRLVPFSAPTLWRRVKDKQFPAPHKLGRITAWRWGDVREYLDAQARQVAA